MRAHVELSRKALACSLLCSYTGEKCRPDESVQVSNAQIHRNLSLYLALELFLLFTYFYCDKIPEQNDRGLCECRCRNGYPWPGFQDKITGSALWLRGMRLHYQSATEQSGASAYSCMQTRIDRALLRVCSAALWRSSSSNSYSSRVSSVVLHKNKSHLLKHFKWSVFPLRDVLWLKLGFHLS